MSGFHFDDGTQATVSVMIIVMVAGLFRFFKDKIIVPMTVLMFLFGLLIGGLTHAFPDMARYIVILGISPKSIFFIFLPLLIFDGSAALKRSVFKNIVWQAILLAGPGMLINSIVVAVFFKFVFYTDWSWYCAILLGATLSATDPVAVVCLLRELNADIAVSTLTDGEAIMNDGTSIILFTIFFEAAATDQFMGAGEAVWRALLLLFGGLIFGFIWAQGILFLLRRTNDAIVETMLSIGGSYVAFYIAENLLHTSPVITMGVIGLIIADSDGKRPLVVSHMYHDMWDGLVYIGNAVIFTLVGALITIEAVPTATPKEWWVMVVSYLLLMLFRVCMMGMMWPLLNLVAKKEYRITKQRFALLVYGSLRGGVGLALALIIHREERLPKEVRNATLFITAGVVVLTLCINGTTAFKIVSWLKLDEAPPYKKFSAKQTEMLIQSTINESIRGIMMLPENHDTNIVTLKEKTIWAFRTMDDICLSQYDNEEVLKPLIMRAFRTQLWSLRDAEMVSVEVFAMLINLCDIWIDDGEFLDVDVVLHEAEKVFHSTPYTHLISFCEAVKSTCMCQNVKQEDNLLSQSLNNDENCEYPVVVPMKRRSMISLNSRYHVPEDESNEVEHKVTEVKSLKSTESPLGISLVSCETHCPVPSQNVEYRTNDAFNNGSTSPDIKPVMSPQSAIRRTDMLGDSPNKNNQQKREVRFLEHQEYTANEGDAYICEALVTYISLVNSAKGALSSYSSKGRTFNQFKDEVNRMLCRGKATLAKFKSLHPSVVKAVVTKKAIQHALLDVKRKVSVLHNEKGLPRSMYLQNTEKILRLSYEASLIHLSEVANCTPRSIFGASSICKGLSEENIDQLFECAVIGTIGPRKKIQMCGIAVLISGKVTKNDFPRPYHYIPSDNFGVYAVLKQVEYDDYFTVVESEIAVIEERNVAKFCRQHESFLRQIWSIVGAQTAVEEISHFYPYNMMKSEDVRHICAQGNVIFNREDTPVEVPNRCICILLLGRDVDGMYDSLSTLLLPTPLKTTFAAHSALYMIKDSGVLFGTNIVPCSIPFIAESNRLMSRINASHTATTDTLEENPLSASASSVMHMLMKYAGSHIAGTYHILSDAVVQSVVPEEMRLEILAEQRDLCLTIQTWMSQEVVGTFNPRRMDKILSDWERGTSKRQEWVKIVLESTKTPENMKMLLRRIHRAHDIITDREERVFWEKLEFVHKTRFINPIRSDSRKKRKSRATNAYNPNGSASASISYRADLSEMEIDVDDSGNFNPRVTIGNTDTIGFLPRSIFLMGGIDDDMREPFDTMTLDQDTFFPRNVSMDN